MSGDKDIEIVQQGYDKVAKMYREQRSDYLVKLSIFREWVNNCQDGKVVELGCATGYPVGQHVIHQGLSYLGIDISQVSINMAQKDNPGHHESFLQWEMLDFMRSQPEKSLGGVIGLFSINHIDRVKHVDLFTQVYRALQPDGVFLITAGDHAWEGESQNWFGEHMYWSGFSYQVYQLILEELGFEIMLTQKDRRLFQNAYETTWYILTRRPARKDD